MKNIYADILDSIKSGNSLVLETSFTGDEGVISESMTRCLENLSLVKCGDEPVVLDTTLASVGERFVLREPVLPRERLIILGGGHIALSLGEFASKCGFSVFVADDRPDFANTARFPWASGVICDSFENSIKRLAVTAYDYVVLVTRGHSHDADCLRAILPGTEPAYLGMIGSRRRVAGLLKMLEDEGYSKDRLSRICTPIGLKIGSVTPEEISISILAEVIAYKRLPANNHNARYGNASDLEHEIIEYLAENHAPKAIVTVIKTVGSTPRGTGAKMAVSPVGAITGTIGGGCAESDIIRDAIDIIGTGRYKTVTIDMSGDVAENDGMVCGGTMQVLIEDGSEVN